MSISIHVYTIYMHLQMYYMAHAMTGSTATLVGLMTLVATHCITSASAAKILIYPFGHCLNSHLLNAEKVSR